MPFRAGGPMGKAQALYVAADHDEETKLKAQQPLRRRSTDRFAMNRQHDTDGHIAVRLPPIAEEDETPEEKRS